MICIENLTYTYPDSSASALSDVTLQIEEGEFVLVSGPSGAGKSTLLRCLNGLVPHFTGGTMTGSVTVAGRDPVADGPQVLSRIVGFVFQDPEAQFVVDRVEDEIAFALENCAVPLAEMRSRVGEMLGLLDLTPLRDRPLETLSGGEKQRVAIATALALRPRVLVLDEPTSQLDPQSAGELLSALVRLNRKLGLTIVLAEHRLERILPHASRVIYLPGPDRPLLSGPPREVLHRVDLAPPLITLGKAMEWDPLPLTVEEGRSFVGEALSDSRFQGRRSSARIEASKEAVLRIEKLSFAYDGIPVLRDISLTVGEGELVVLMGRNGAGKTTLLKCIVGLLRPRRGMIALAGESLIDRETVEICRSVGYLPQEPSSLLFADTVAEELRVTLRNHGLLGSPPMEEADLLDRLGLTGLATFYPRDLSVGERQRVALAAVTVTRPRLLLLDEPTRGMDYQAKREMVRLLQEWQVDGTGVLLVTQDVEFAARAADRVVVLGEGEVVAEGAPGQVLTSSAQFAPQMARLFPHTDWVTVDDALSALRRPG
ncbi:MAG: ATP-binding cassette domain-containing protein [Anaerolineae bacterium]|jgi:energy-coupling factor transport system ATP-binding protein